MLELIWEIIAVILINFSDIILVTIELISDVVASLLNKSMI